MSLKCWEKYVVTGVIVIILIFLLFFPSRVVFLNNETMFSSVVGFMVPDVSIFTALVVGISSMLVALYVAERTFKAMKLSAIPDTSVNLLIDLEFEFNEFKRYNQKGNGDEFILLIQILKYWRDHQKAFRLLTPNFYKEFLRLISSGEEIKDCSNQYCKNSKCIIKAIKAQITDIAFENENYIFSFIKPELIEDMKNINDNGEKIENYMEFKINKINFHKYINNIEGRETSKTTKLMFNEFNKDVKQLLKGLNEEIREYD